jgi:hypothetical protein
MSTIIIADVDARKTPQQFDILCWTERGYSAARRHPQFFLRLETADPS